MIEKEIRKLRRQILSLELQRTTYEYPDLLDDIIAELHAKIRELQQ